MEKRFWLICIVAPKNIRTESEMIPKYKLYRVSTNDPDSVTVPLNTIAFGFVETDMTESEVLKELSIIKFTKRDLIISVAEKTYILGELIAESQGIKYVWNSELNYTFSFSGEQIILYN